MDFTVPRDILKEAVKWTAQTVPQRPSVPILAGIRLTAEDGVLELSSYDYETSTRSQIPAEVDVPGDILVPGKLLASITQSLPNAPVRCKLEDTRMKLECGAAHFVLATMSVDEYPTMPVMPQTRGSFDSKVLSEAISQVSIAASRDDTIPLLTGVRIEIDDDTITFLGTDRYRLAMKEFKWNPSEAGVSTSLLVKASTLSEVAKSMTSAGSVDFAFDIEQTGPNSLVGFTAGARQSTSTLMDGEYPPVRRLFPEETNVHAVVKRDVLLEAVKRVSLVAEQKTSVRLIFEGEELTLRAGQDDSSQASEQVPVALHGEALQTAFNPSFLQAGLSALDTDYVRFSFTEPMKPAVITGQNEQDGEDDLTYRYLLMPIRFGI